ncbi:Protein of unknown function [Bacillus cytotoxicus]|uniref:Uncharacterized protein n=1 Tax=Bacillus cytotoxicus TaxID=580165 RepID=A0AAX2CEW6_9BACI|nr:Protein of unknown function [Bacillus cytotoxicus]
MFRFPNLLWSPKQILLMHHFLFH